MNEFQLIEHYFHGLSHSDSRIVVNNGDDGAVVRLEPHEELVVSTDTLVSGVHFLPEWEAHAIAHKALAVNLSDMAAMGATPRWITLNLTLPEVNQEWLAGFAQGLQALLSSHAVQLIGGDTTRGPLCIGLTALGTVTRGKAVTRSGAKPGDKVYVTGKLGAAALAVRHIETGCLKPIDAKLALEVLQFPQPRLDWLPLLQNYATAAIDISDGLAADLNHICNLSQCGAILTELSIPISELVSKYLSHKSAAFVLSGGDDYELCLTVSPQRAVAFEQAVAKVGLDVFEIGQLCEARGLVLLTNDQGAVPWEPKGYQHF